MFKSRERTEEYEKLLWFLYTRAWLTDIPMMVSRVAMKAMHLGTYYKPDCVIGHK